MIKTTENGTENPTVPSERVAKPGAAGRPGATARQGFPLPFRYAASCAVSENRQLKETAFFSLGTG
jgi:hypothetical protein